MRAERLAAAGQALQQQRRQFFHRARPAQAQVDQPLEIPGALPAADHVFQVEIEPGGGVEQFRQLAGRQTTEIMGANANTNGQRCAHALASDS